MLFPLLFPLPLLVPPGSSLPLGNWRPLPKGPLPFPFAVPVPGNTLAFWLEPELDDESPMAYPMPPNTSAAMIAAATRPSHFGMKMPAGRSAGAVAAAAVGAGAGATGLAWVASGSFGAAAAAGAGATSSSSPAFGTAASSVKGLVSAVGASSGVAGDGSPSAFGVSSVMSRSSRGRTLPTLMVVARG